MCSRTPPGCATYENSEADLYGTREEQKLKRAAKKAGVSEWQTIEGSQAGPPQKME
jgi:hypothetical protein